VQRQLISSHLVQTLAEELIQRSQHHQAIPQFTLG
jgi:hypothetical protein